MNIRVVTTQQGWSAAKLALHKNIHFYGMEALGLGIFMISACSFTVLLESPVSPIHAAIPNGHTRLYLSGVLMGLTALLIFYSPWTAPSGSHINPAVTLTFLRLGRIGPWDALFYVLFQTLGGLIAVWLMALALGPRLTKSPVSYAVTIPGKGGPWAALLAELLIGFIMMTIVLQTGESKQGSRYTRPIAACLVCANVIIAGPISGFGMNPARSLASALPAGIFTGWWIYLFAPVLSMLTAAEFYKRLNRTKQ